MKSEPHPQARYLPFGDNALVVEIGDAISFEINRKVIALNDAILKARIRGVEELVPTYRSILARYDPLKTTCEDLAFHIKDVERTLKDLTKEKESRKITVPVVYGGEYGLDLAYVARFHSLSEEQVVELHSEREYRVYMIGFVAGFPYLGEVPDEITTPRLETPRLKVPAGSVGIAEKQTGIYPCEAPGGWRIIAKTPLKLFDTHQREPALLKPGDTVKFKPISEEEFRIIEDAVLKGIVLPISES